MFNSIAAIQANFSSMTTDMVDRGSDSPMGDARPLDPSVNLQGIGDVELRDGFKVSERELAVTMVFLETVEQENPVAIALLKHRAESPFKASNTSLGQLATGLILSLEDELRPSNFHTLTEGDQKRTMDQIGLAVLAVMKNGIQLNEYKYQVMNPLKKV